MRPGKACGPLGNSYDAGYSRARRIVSVSVVWGGFGLGHTQSRARARRDGGEWRRSQSGCRWPECHEHVENGETEKKLSKQPWQPRPTGRPHRVILRSLRGRAEWPTAGACGAPHLVPDQAKGRPGEGRCRLNGGERRYPTPCLPAHARAGWMQVSASSGPGVEQREPVRVGDLDSPQRQVDGTGLFRLESAN